MRRGLRIILGLGLSYAGTAHAAATVQILHVLQSAREGSTPVSGVIVGAGNMLFGTATSGGAANAGTIFELKPPKPKQTAWTLVVQHQFGGMGDGGDPAGGLTLAPNGIMYGTTVSGGSSNASSGTIYQFVPPVPPRLYGSKLKLYNFLGRKEENGSTPVDGYWPSGKVYVDASGNLIGSTFAGGIPNYGCCLTDDGTWWKLSPPAPGQTTWTETILPNPGFIPSGGVIGDSFGNLFGTTPASTADVKNSTFFNFGANNWSMQLSDADGRFPTDPVLDAAGNLYCATQTLTGGAVLELPVTNNGATPANKAIVIYQFQGGADGGTPMGPLVPGPNGSLYGTTISGGANGFGTIYQLTPPVSGTVWTHAVLYSFDGTAAKPSGPLTPGPNGVFYGTTQASSATGTGGAIYQFTP